MTETEERIEQEEEGGLREVFVAPPAPSTASAVPPERPNLEGDDILCE
jgi:hypothetical protein